MALREPIPPSPWIVRFATEIADPVLDIACGSGRHLRWLLDRGHRVTGVDRNISGLADLATDKRVEILAADLESPQGGWPFGDRSFATVIVTNYLWRPLLPDIIGAVAPGGRLLYETFAVGNEAFGKPSNPDFLLKRDELREAVTGELSVIAFEQGQITDPHPAVVQRLCAIRG